MRILVFGGASDVRVKNFEALIFIGFHQPYILTIDAPSGFLASDKMSDELSHLLKP